MLRTAHYFTRQALREQRAARQALTDAARDRHSALAAHFASLAATAQGGRPAAED